MKDKKIIRGKPIYLYKHSQYLEMPEKCIIKKVVYDESTNKSTVYCGKPSIALEVVLSLIIVLCVFVNVAYLHDLKYVVKYSSLATYYNGELFVNVYNDDSNTGIIDVSIQCDGVTVHECTLNPGEYLISVPVEAVNSEYSMVISYHTFTKTISEEVPITVQIRGS